MLCSHDFEMVDKLAPRLVVLEAGQMIKTVPPGGRVQSRDEYRQALLFGSEKAWHPTEIGFKNDLNPPEIARNRSV